MNVTHTRLYHQQMTKYITVTRISNVIKHKLNTVVVQVWILHLCQHIVTGSTNNF